MEQITRVNLMEGGSRDMLVNALLYYLGGEWRYLTLGRVCMLMFKVTTKKCTRHKI